MFSFCTPLQLLSRPSQISVAPAQLGLHTPPGKLHCHVPPWQVTLTCVVHSGLVADGLTPHTWEGDGANTPSSIVPLQLSSTPLHVSCDCTKLHGYSHFLSLLRSYHPGWQLRNWQTPAEHPQLACTAPALQ